MQRPFSPKPSSPAPNRNCSSPISSRRAISSPASSASLTVATAEEIKALFLEFQAAGVTFFQTLKREPWGARDFILKDPDGNLLLFAGPKSPLSGRAMGVLQIAR